MIQCYLFAVHQPNQALTAADVVADAAVGQPVDHGAVVHNISAEEQLIVMVVEADAAPGVTGHVEDRQLPVAQVDDITWRVRRQRYRYHVTSSASHSQAYIHTKSYFLHSLTGWNQAWVIFLSPLISMMHRV